MKNMMKVIWKLVRIVFFLMLYFFLTFVFVLLAPKEWPDGTLFLIAIGFPVVLVWWQEKRRAQKLAAKAKKQSVSSRSRPAPGKTNLKSRHRSVSLTNRSRSKHDGWVSRGDSATVAKRKIGGMVYVGTAPAIRINGSSDKCRAYIDPSLTVARKGVDVAGESLPYWPGYSQVSSQGRATYLEWLASGRSDSSYNPGYMFIYFYGLERRFFVDQSSEDVEDIVREVSRLRTVYPDNRSVSRYLGEFLDVAAIAEARIEDIDPVFERQGSELPQRLKYAIGARIAMGENLSAPWLLSWFMCHPECNLRTPATRCREEFLALFTARFEDRFPGGLKINKPRKMLKVPYSAASGEFETTLAPSVNGQSIPDISGLRKPVEIAQELAEEVMGDLDKLSRFLGRNPGGRGTVEAHALLPFELWQTFPSEEIDSLRSWSEGIVDRGGLVTLADVIHRLEGKRPIKVGKRQLTGAADALARLSIGLAPDPRFALRSPKPEEPVVLFRMEEAVERLEDASEHYRNALIELALGSLIAHSDGLVTSSERVSLEAQVDSASMLNDEEKRRLRANLSWYLAVEPDMSFLRRKLKEVDEKSRAAMRAALVNAALADGVVHTAEVGSIEKIYSALGLDPATAYSDLHAGSVSDEPIKVRRARADLPGEAIPKQESASDSKLDHLRIAAIQSDTERVSSVLGQIFDVEEDQDQVISPACASFLPGLDQKHSDLILDLLARENWSEAGFEQCCKGHGLMASGALEVLNEWAYENYDDVLLDEYEGYDVSSDIVDAIKQQLKLEGIDVEAEAT